MEACQDHVYNTKVVHNVLRRGVQQLLKHLDQEAPMAQEHLEDYLGFMTAYLEFLHAHHAHEEEIIFPEFESMGVKMTTLGEEHKTLETLMSDLETISKCKDPAQFSLEVCKEKLTSLNDLMETHLVAEEQVVTVDVMQKAGFTGQQVTAMEDRILKMVKKKDPTLMLPIMYYNITEEERGKFWKDNFPWVLRMIIFPFFIARAHAGYWDFAFNKQPKGKAIKA